MSDLERLGPADFEARIGESFVVLQDDAELLALELTGVEVHVPPDPGADSRGSFIVLFRGPREPVLPQATYRLRNDALGELVLFVVPERPEASGQPYAVTFG